MRAVAGATARKEACSTELRALRPTDKGAALERQLSETQRRRIARAYREAGAESVEGFRTVLLGIIDEENRHQVLPDKPCRPARLRR